MPLINCPDCQAEISDAAPSCIKCGRPMGDQSTVKPSRYEAPTYPVDQQSLKSNQWQHPTSKEIVTINNDAPFWALLFGGFYLAYKGHAGQGILWIILSLFTVGIAWLILPFFVKGILEKEYIVNGWIRGGTSHLVNKPKKIKKTRKKMTEKQKRRQKLENTALIIIFVGIPLYVIYITDGLQHISR